MKIGIIGLGSIGSRHAKNLLSDKHEVVAYDPKLAPLPGIDKVWECDAIVIASPTPTHRSYLFEAIARKKHVFVEKPISVQPNIGGMLQGAEEQGLIVFVGCNLRFHPCVITTKEMLDDELIGIPYWAHFNAAQRNTKYKDSVTLNWGAHEIDISLYLLGPGDVITASLSGSPDTMADILLNHNGVRSSIHLDYHADPEWRGYTIIGTSGRIACDLPGRKLFVHKKGMQTRKHDFSDKLINHWDSDYQDEMRAFIDRIQGKETLGATGKDGLAALEIICEAQRMGSK